jgi:hypothetical protein
MQRTSTNQRFLVSPWGFDNIGAVLAKMGQGFDHEQIGWGKIKSTASLRGADVLFVNCAMRFAFGYGKRAAPALREFVAEGGVLYASDWAVAGVHAAFPEMVQYDMDGQKGRMPCSVVDRGLQELLQIFKNRNAIACYRVRLGARRSKREPISGRTGRGADGLSSSPRRRPMRRRETWTAIAAPTFWKRSYSTAAPPRWATCFFGQPISRAYGHLSRRTSF